MQSTSPQSAKEASLLKWMRVSSLCLLLGALSLSWHKKFSIDEFLYAHASWLVSLGKVPYRDFFEHHAPLQYLVLGLIRYGFLDSHPHHILVYRLVHFAVLVLSLFCLARLHRHSMASAFSVLAFLAVSLSVNMALEVRPDSFAVLFFLASLACLRGGRSPHWSLVAGLCFALAVWSSLKALIYGFPVLLLWSLAFRKSLGVCTKNFFLGLCLVAFGASLYLVQTESLFAFWYWCFKWAAHHQENYPSLLMFWEFPWFRSLYQETWWLYPLAFTGIASSIRKVIRSWKHKPVWFEVLMLACTGSTFILIGIQSAPYDYNSIIWVMVLAYFAGSGFQAAYLKLAESKGNWVAVSASASVVFALFMVAAIDSGHTHIYQNNRYQLQVLSRLNEMTYPSDCIHDNSGSSVSREHAHYYFFNDALIRWTDPRIFSQQIPRAIQQKGCTIALHDVRSKSMPQGLSDFLSAHFLPYNGDIWVWGKRIPPKATIEFKAIKPGAYFAVGTDPPKLDLDGRPMKSTVTQLDKGTYAITNHGKTESFFLWLPRDGKIFLPRFSTPHFSVLLTT